MSTYGPLWTQMLELPRVPVAQIQVYDIPLKVGVYIWLRDDEPIYAGSATAKKGLQKRLSAHLNQKVDFSRSSLRRNVADQLLGIPTSITRARKPSLVTQAQATVVNDWLRQCSLAWTTFDTAVDAKLFEKDLLAEWMPPLSRR